MACSQPKQYLYTSGIPRWIGPGECKAMIFPSCHGLPYIWGDWLFWFYRENKVCACCHVAPFSALCPPCTPSLYLFWLDPLFSRPPNNPLSSP
jgi:hypothetical protein